MTFPSEHKDKPGRFYKSQETNEWTCEVCGVAFPEYQQIMGHMGAHPLNGIRIKPTGRPSNIRNKDPMGMTIGEMVETIEGLRKKIEEVEDAAKEAIEWREKVKMLFSIE
jgi:hypothetical protein